MRILATADFINAAHSHQEPSTFCYNSSIQVNEFCTKDTFWRPDNSEFIHSFNDLDKKPVQIYTFNQSKCILFLSKETPDKFRHIIYTTDREDGFLLTEVFDLVAVFGL